MTKEAPKGLKARLLGMIAMRDHPASNQNEASIAAEMLEKLIREYAIEVTELEADGGGEGDVDTAREKMTCRMGRLTDWQNRLLESITDNNFCLVFRESEESRLYYLIGRQINVRAVLHLYDYLSKTIERISPYNDKREKAYLSFRQGCVNALTSRLWDQRRAAERASEQSRGNGSDLVLASVYGTEAEKNRDLRFNLAPGTTARENAEFRARCAAASKAREEAARNAPPKPVEPEAERLARVAREKIESDKSWADYQRRQRKEAAKRDQAAYSMGQDAGAKISLNRQITEAERAAMALR